MWATLEQMGIFAAGAIIASVPVMLLFFMLQDLVEGLTADSKLIKRHVASDIQHRILLCILTGFLDCHSMY